MLVTYRPKKGREEELLALVRRHWPTLSRLGLVTREPARVYRTTDIKNGGVAFVEMFEWKDENASDVAHQTPEVMAIWEPMGPILEALELNTVAPVG
jgi:hypothetical protein